MLLSVSAYIWLVSANRLVSVSPAFAGLSISRGMQSCTQECPVHHSGNFMSVSFCVKTRLENYTFHVHPHSTLFSVEKK